MGEILQETTAVLKSTHALREKRFRFYGEEDEEVEAIDGGGIQVSAI